MIYQLSYIRVKKTKAVAILAIMELGDLRTDGAVRHPLLRGRNPRYNGIG